jgi:hypothetical protein
MVSSVGIPRKTYPRVLNHAYADHLNKAQIKRREADSLKDRAQMLRPTTRGTSELIYVAGLRVLGWTMADLSRSLAAAGRREGGLHRAIANRGSLDHLPGAGVNDAPLERERAGHPAVDPDCVGMLGQGRRLCHRSA